jgi:hypothetical protein
MPQPFEMPNSVLSHNIGQVRNVAGDEGPAHRSSSGTPRPVHRCTTGRTCTHNCKSTPDPPRPARSGSARTPPASPARSSPDLKLIAPPVHQIAQMPALTRPHAATIRHATVAGHRTTTDHRYSALAEPHPALLIAYPRRRRPACRAERAAVADSYCSMTLAGMRPRSLIPMPCSLCDVASGATREIEGVLGRGAGHMRDRLLDAPFEVARSHRPIRIDAWLQRRHDGRSRSLDRIRPNGHEALSLIPRRRFTSQRSRRTSSSAAMSVMTTRPLQPRNAPSAVPPRKQPGLARLPRRGYLAAPTAQCFRAEISSAKRQIS